MVLSLLGRRLGNEDEDSGRTGSSHALACPGRFHDRVQSSSDTRCPVQQGLARYGAAVPSWRTTEQRACPPRLQIQAHTPRLGVARVPGTLARTWLEVKIQLLRLRVTHTHE
jgi:hypothetical protein